VGSHRGGRAPSLVDALTLGELLGNQAGAVGATFVFSFVATFSIAKLIDLTIGLRVDEAAENAGLDLTPHAETAYS
jgi:ammonium transporter, Amt family